MTDPRERPDILDDWRAVLDALDAVIEAAPCEPDGAHDDETTEIEDVRRLVRLRLADHCRDRLPRLWVRRGGPVSVTETPRSTIVIARDEPSDNGTDGIAAPPPRQAGRAKEKEGARATVAKPQK